MMNALASSVNRTFSATTGGLINTALSPPAGVVRSSPPFPDSPPQQSPRVCVTPPPSANRKRELALPRVMGALPLSPEETGQLLVSPSSAASAAAAVLIASIGSGSNLTAPPLSPAPPPLYGPAKLRPRQQFIAATPTPGSPRTRRPPLRHSNEQQIMHSVSIIGGSVASSAASSSVPAASSPLPSLSAVSTTPPGCLAPALSAAALSGAQAPVKLKRPECMSPRSPRSLSPSPFQMMPPITTPLSASVTFPAPAGLSIPTLPPSPTRLVSQPFSSPHLVRSASSSLTVQKNG